MKPERWKEIEKLYQAARERKPDERESFLEEACAGDEELCREVESLLGYEQKARDFIESPALDLAARELAGEEGDSRIGSRIGSYRILSLLARGGMGEVYLAQDERLDRHVALKFLPEELRRDETARRRFLREAKSAAALDHPFICKIYEAGEGDGTAFIAMEYVQGETLAEKLARGRLPLKRALETAAEVAEALEAAHRRNIVHRDLKPSNILVTPEGHAKVMDFGLAKRLPSGEGSDGRASTIAADLTRTGMTLGTLAYMSPEQLRGEVVDARSDIFSLGVVLYEMLTGRHPFRKPEAVETGHAILSETPPLLSESLERVPLLLEHALTKMLAKEAERRYQHVGDVRIDLEGLMRAGPEAGLPVPVPAGRTTRARLAWIAAGVVVMLLAAASTLSFLHLRDRPQVQGPVRFVVTHAGGVAPFLTHPVLSPDGRHIAFHAFVPGTWQLWVRSLDSFTAQPLAGTEGARWPFWSPDGREIAFFAEGKLKKITLAGGRITVLCEAGDASGLYTGRGGSWSSNGTIVFALFNGPLWQVSASGGLPKPATALGEGETDHRWPSFLPDGRRFIYLSVGRPDTAGIYAGSLDGKEEKRIHPSTLNAAFAPPNYLLFLDEGTLLAQPFDLVRLEPLGEPFPVAEEVTRAESRPSRRALFSVSQSGVLVYASGGCLPLERLIWFDRAGNEIGALAKLGNYSNLGLSPDGKHLAVSEIDPKRCTRDVWVVDLTRETWSRLTFDPADETNPTWSPDGRFIAFISDREGVRRMYRTPASGAGGEETLLESPIHNNVEDWSSDGRHLIYNRPGAGERDLWVLPLEGDGEPVPYLRGRFEFLQARFSPDGRWVAYRSNESGRPEIYVQAFPATGGKWQVSTNGGAEPQWRADGREIFYREQNKLMAVDVKAEGAVFQRGNPSFLFEAHFSKTNLRNNYVVSADGSRFLVITRTEDDDPTTSFHVVLNWTAGLGK